MRTTTKFPLNFGFGGKAATRLDPTSSKKLMNPDLVGWQALICRFLTVAPCACCVNLCVCMYKMSIFGVFEYFQSLSLYHFVSIFLFFPFFNSDKNLTCDLKPMICTMTRVPEALVLYYCFPSLMSLVVNSAELEHIFHDRDSANFPETKLNDADPPRRLVAGQKQ
jgi:hypothetical protein